MASEEAEDSLFYDAEEGNMQTDGMNSNYYESNLSNMNYSNKITAENMKITNSNYSHSPRGNDNSNTLNRYSESSKRNVSNLTGLYFSPDEDIGTSRGAYTWKYIRTCILMYI
jgi:hypothetical protein